MAEVDETSYPSSFPADWLSFDKATPEPITKPASFDIPLRETTARQSPVRNAYLAKYRTPQQQAAHVISHDFAYSTDEPSGSNDSKRKTGSIKVKDLPAAPTPDSDKSKHVTFSEHTSFTAPKTREEATEYTTAYPAHWTVATGSPRATPPPPLITNAPPRLLRSSKGDAQPRFLGKQRAKSVFIPREKTQSKRLVVTEYPHELRQRLNEAFPGNNQSFSHWPDRAPNLDITKIAADNRSFHNRLSSGESTASRFQIWRPSNNDTPAKMRKISSNYSNMGDYT